MMISKGITALEQMGILTRTLESGDDNPPASSRWQDIYFSYRVHQDQKRAVTAAGKGGYTATVKNIYGAPPPSPEYQNEVIKDIQTTLQGMQTQGYKLEGLAQANAVLTRSKSTVMSQLAHMTVIMNYMQAQLKTIALE